MNNTIELDAAETTMKNTFKQYASEVPTLHNTIQFDTLQHANFSEEKDTDSQQSFQEDYREAFNYAELRKEEEALEIIKVMW